MKNNEQLIREIAEEMAKAHTDEERARIAVRKMADAVDKALRYAEWRKYEERQAYLCFQGLIPEVGKEGGYQ